MPRPDLDFDPTKPTAKGGVPVRLRGVRRTFATGTEAIAGLDLDIAAGSFVALLGPSGCGKSTLLRLVAGLDQPDAGEVIVGEGGARPSPLPSPSPSIAYVFQDPHLMPWRRNIDNVALPLELAGVPPRERREKALAALEKVGLADAAERYPGELSGGMRMRASLARALVIRPQILLLDEPFAALDELTRHRLDDQLRALWIDLGMTVLFVTHAIGEAAYLAERAVVFSRRPARIVADRILDLPRERSFALRAEPAFGKEERLLYDALVRGEAA
jgi:NitT/TauT family transport system ATP-binding protein